MPRTKAKRAPTDDELRAEVDVMIVHNAKRPTGSNTYKVYYGSVHKLTVQADDMPVVIGYCADNKISWNAIKRID
jgi:hypothetical protein